MIKVVCNTSPIIGLSSINKLNLLWEMFDTIIPKEVYSEVISGNETKICGKEELIKAVEEGKIKIFHVEDQEFLDMLIERKFRISDSLYAKLLMDVGEI